MTVKDGEMEQSLDTQKSPGSLVEKALQEEMRGAAKALRHGASAEHAVHHARRCLKRARSAIKLGRSGCGKRRYHKIDRNLRNAAHLLSDLRNAEAQIEAFDRIMNRFCTAIDCHIFAKTRDYLVMSCKHTQTKLLEHKKNALRARKRVEKASSEFADAAWIRPGKQALLFALGKAYARGRNAFLNAWTKPTPLTLHNLRRKSKNLRYEIELLGDYSTGDLSRLAKDLHILTDALGENHDLDLLKNAVQNDRLNPEDETAQLLLLFLIEKRQEELERAALLWGQHVYIDGAKKFARDLRSPAQQMGFGSINSDGNRACSFH